MVIISTKICHFYPVKLDNWMARDASSNRLTLLFLYQVTCQYTEHLPARTVWNLWLHKLVDVSKFIFTTWQRVWQCRDVQPTDNTVRSALANTKTQQTSNTTVSMITATHQLYSTAPDTVIQLSRSSSESLPTVNHLFVGSKVISDDRYRIPSECLNLTLLTPLFKDSNMPTKILRNKGMTFTGALEQSNTISDMNHWCGGLALPLIKIIKGNGKGLPSLSSAPWCLYPKAQDWNKNTVKRGNWLKSVKITVICSQYFKLKKVAINVATIWLLPHTLPYLLQI